MMIRIILLLLVCTLLSSCKESESEVVEQNRVEEYKHDLKISTGIDAKADAKIVSVNMSGFSISPEDIVLGDPNSKVVFIEYFSPTCPHCVTYHKLIFPEVKANYIDSKKIAYVIREFIGNKQDLDATLLARCKKDVDTYLKFIDIFLSKQDNWAFNKNYREILTNIGSLGGVSPEAFSVCLNDQEKIKILMENTKLANSVPNFPGTPSFFINGEIFKGRYTFEDLSKSIDKALAVE